MEVLTLAGGSILLGIGSGLCIWNSQKLTKDPSYSNNKMIQQAHNYLLWTAILCWVIIAILIFLIVLLVIGKLRFDTLIKIGLAIVIAGLLVAGGLSVAAGATIRDAQHPDSAINGIYFQTILTTILFLGGVFLVSAVLIILAGRPEMEVKAEEAKVVELKQEEHQLEATILTEQAIAPTQSTQAESAVVGQTHATTLPANPSARSSGFRFTTPGGYTINYG